VRIRYVGVLPEAVVPYIGLFVRGEPKEVPPEVGEELIKSPQFELVPEEVQPKPTK